MTRLIRILWLTAIWLALWSELSVANLLSGLAVATLVAFTFDTWRSGHIAFRPVAVAKLGGFFLVQLVVSTVAVGRTIVAPRHRIHRGIVAIPLEECSDAVVTVIADAITLTPGTLTLEVSREPLVIYVHTLDVRSVDALRRDVRTLERLATNAFGSRS